MRTLSTSLLASVLAITPAALAQLEWKQAEFPANSTQPKVYVFPMGFEGKGQLLTDVSQKLIEKIVEDAKEQKPDIVVIKLNSAEFNKIWHLNDERPEEMGVPAFEEFRTMMTTLQDGLRDIPQVMWVEDAVGYGTLMALGWPRLYMTSDARLMGLTRVRDRAAGWDDPDVAAKMLAAATSIGKGLPQRGGYPEALADAMIFPERQLSVNFKGRSVDWLRDTNGVWVVDGSDEAPANFRAPLAEDLLLSDGTADTLDDLMFLLGYREFTTIDTGEKISREWVADWRAALEKIGDMMEEAGDTEDSVQGLTKRRQIYERAVSLLKQYPCLEFRRELQQSGVSKDSLEDQIDQIKKELQRQREAGRQGGGGGGGGGGTGRGPGGAGRGR
jgi:hypothetical protein